VTSATGPVLNPAARLLWRSPSVLQVEIGSWRTLVDELEPRRLRSLLTGAGDDVTDSAAMELQRLGILWPAADDDPDPRRVPPRPWLATELAALTVQSGQGAADALQRRARSVIAVHGANRAAAQVAAVLAASGIGHVFLADASHANLAATLPGGATPEDEGRLLSAAAADAVQRAAPGADTSPLPFGERPDLVVLASDEPVDPEQRDALHARGCAHLLVQLGAGFGAVGPMVLPGVTSCLSCVDLHRVDRDPAWPALAVQLAQRPRSGTPAGAALATAVGGLAALQALAHLDGLRPAAIEGTIELHLPDWRLRRRSWPVHPSCTCTAS
jgi:hypothetical protein